MLLGAVPGVLAIGQAAVVDETCCGIDASDSNSGTAWQGVGLEDATKGAFSREIIAKGKKLALLYLG